MKTLKLFMICCLAFAGFSAAAQSSKWHASPPFAIAKSDGNMFVVLCTKNKTLEYAFVTAQKLKPTMLQKFRFKFYVDPVGSLTKATPSLSGIGEPVPFNDQESKGMIRYVVHPDDKEMATTFLDDLYSGSKLIISLSQLLDDAIFWEISLKGAARALEETGCSTQ